MLTSRSRISQNACVLVLGLLGSGALPAVAGAAPSVTRNSVIVRYGDLDLSRRDDILALYTRLEHAARKVCRPHDWRELMGGFSPRKCRESALSDGVRQVNHSTLAALHRAHWRANAAAG
jgi:UrcA family protein